VKIIIVGCGKAGYALARNLSSEKDLDVTIIDCKPDSLEKANETLDAMLIKGDGLNSDTLLEAGAKGAELIIAVTEADERNILTCILAKQIGIRYSIARVRTPEYAFNTNKFWRGLGLDMIINPELQTAQEISRLLRFPTVDDIDIFVGGKVELVSFNVSEASDFFVGKSVSDVFYLKKMNVLLATIEREHSVIIPHGDCVFEKDDVIRVLGYAPNIMGFFSLIGKNTGKIKNATIIGGGRVTYYLVDMLQKYSKGTKVKIIETDREKCEKLSVKFPHCLIINGDGTDESVLALEDADKKGAVVCLSNKDEQNAIVSLYSLQFGMRKVIVKLNQIDSNMVKNLKLGSIISPQNISSEQIIRYTRALRYSSSGVKTIYKIFSDNNDRVEAVELNVNKKYKCLDIPLKKIKMKKDILIGCIIRNSNIIIPTGESVMSLWDSIIIIAKNEDINELDDIMYS